MSVSGNGVYRLPGTGYSVNDFGNTVDILGMARLSKAM